jgi:hypothetical protein
MKEGLRLHHVAKRLRTGTPEVALDLFETLGLQTVYRPEYERWAMVGGGQSGLSIQLAEVDMEPLTHFRTASHIGFLSDNPIGDIQIIENWALEKNLQFEMGAWSDRELWADLPDLFVDFVIEVMHNSIVEE